MSAALRQVLREVQRDAPRLARSFQTSAAPKSGYSHYDFEHGPNYMNFQAWPGRKQKVATIIIGMIVTGIGIPGFAVWYQQQKLKG